MKRRSVGVLGLVVALVALFSLHALRKPLEELWLLQRLESERVDLRKNAALRLAGHRSVRAVRPLVALFLAEPPVEADRSHSYRPSPPVSSVWEESLVAIGSRALPEKRSKNPLARAASKRRLSRIAPTSRSTSSRLCAAPTRATLRS